MERSPSVDPHGLLWTRQIEKDLTGWLCALVIARFYRRAKHSPLVVPADIRDFSRQLSRMVYVLLYLTIGVRQVICIVDHIWHGDYPDGFGPDEAFQVFVVYGLVALALIRVLAFGIGLRVADDAADE